MVPNEIAVLRADGVCLVLDASGPGLPAVLYWGNDPGLEPGDAQRAFATAPLDRPSQVRNPLPLQGDGWFGRPGLAGHRDGTVRPVRFELTAPVAVAVAGADDAADAADADDAADAGDRNERIEVHAADPDAGLRLHTTIEMTPEGLLRIRHTLINTGDSVYTLEHLGCALPIPARAEEILDFAGRWARERSPQRTPLGQGTWSRESRRGRTGFDAGPLTVGTPGLAFRHGEAWCVHTAWSGNHVQYAERLADGSSVIGGAELLDAGEIRLSPGQAYRTPWIYFVASTTGLDGLSRRFHRHLRARPSHPATPRPLTLNTWEAVYFDHDPQKMAALADAAAAVGVERFVVDDGWFRHRRQDNAGLGDWYVDPAVWPDGLGALADRVHAHGMQFGLWFEPEMINPDSDLARAHPDWFLADPQRLPFQVRNQQVLDVARPEAHDYLLERISSLVREYGIDYLKWDHNRDLAEAVHAGSPGVHEQTKAVYRLLDELRTRFPTLEIESCSSGGGRADLAILERTDRIWGSDNIDPLERQSIQRWTGIMLPPELVGSHVGAERAHISQRFSDLAFRCATALFGHAGIEADITTWPAEERASLAAWIKTYKRLRPLLHSGETVRIDHCDPAAWIHGVVRTGGITETGTDADHALFAYIQLATTVTSPAPPIRFAGLDPQLTYEVTVLPELSAAEAFWPEWARHGPIAMPGGYLQEIGLAAPDLTNRPGQSFVVELTGRSR